jgi:hypothetical protein
MLADASHCPWHCVRVSHLRRRSGQIEIRPFAYLRFLGWMWLILATLLVAAGCVLIVQWNALGLMFLVLGAMGSVISRLGWMCVRCNADGVTRRLIRTRFYPRNTIATLGIKPVGGIGGSRAEVELYLNNGSRVPLDATLIVRSGPEHAELKAQIAEMRALLGLQSSAPG